MGRNQRLMRAGPDPVPDGARADDPRILLCAGTDLTESGDFGKRWIVVRDGEILLYGAPGVWPSLQGPYLRRSRGEMWDGARLLLAAPPPPEAAVLERLPLAEVARCTLRHEVGNGVLLLESTSGERRPLLRFSGPLTRHMGIAARAVEWLAKGEPLNSPQPASTQWQSPQWRCAPSGVWGPRILSQMSRKKAPGRRDTGVRTI